MIHFPTCRKRWDDHDDPFSFCIRSWHRQNPSPNRGSPAAAEARNRAWFSPISDGFPRWLVSAFQNTTFLSDSPTFWRLHPHLGFPEQSLSNSSHFSRSKKTLCLSEVCKRSSFGKVFLIYFFFEQGPDPNLQVFGIIPMMRLSGSACFACWYLGFLVGFMDFCSQIFRVRYLAWFMDVLKDPKVIYQKMCSKNVASNLELARQLDTLYSKISDTSTVTELIYIVSACCRTELSGVCNPSSQGFLLSFFKILCQQKCQSLLLYFHSNHPIIQWKIWLNTTECLSDYWRITPSSFSPTSLMFSRFAKLRLQELYESPFINHGRPRLYRRTKIWSKFSTWSRNWPRKSGGSQLGFRKNTTGVFSNATLNS